MLGRTLHIKKSLFRFLPNPTFYHWDRKYFSMRRLLQEYRTEVGRLALDEPQIKELQTLASAIADLLLRKLERNGAGRAKRPPEDAIDRPLMNILHDNLDRCDLFLKRKGRKAVEIVLREHVQELLRMVNNEGEYGSTTNVAGGTAGAGAGAGIGAEPSASGPARSGDSSPLGAVSSDDSRLMAPLRFDDVMTASPEVRQRTLMRIYFSRLQPRVVQLAEEAWLQQDDGDSDDEDVDVDGANRDNEGDENNENGDNGENDGNNKHSGGGGGGSRPRKLEAASVWCTLVFRMLCWLLLHDFSKMDVQISKSELLGNRLPVYIW